MGYLRWKTFISVHSIFSSINPQLVILDDPLPFYNGLIGAKRFVVSQVPIMFLSSRNPSSECCTMSINMGADDYMTKR